MEAEEKVSSFNPATRLYNRQLLEIKQSSPRAKNFCEYFGNFFSLHPVFCGYASCWRIFTTFSIVFQLRVVAGTPRSFSILPR